MSNAISFYLSIIPQVSTNLLFQHPQTQTSLKNRLYRYMHQQVLVAPMKGWNDYQTTCDKRTNDFKRKQNYKMNNIIQQLQDFFGQKSLVGKFLIINSLEIYRRT
eukprot:TRINITY_DN14353_c0_g1_i1.p7 TRINITY_DN14353_c0_g1~~TRINITY_DN14353_c0_g1_i1.p7  ORF type:complete len:105 (+),score=0.26 TRINITY_DN14353_c0_g1_i1:375-689(+)